MRGPATARCWPRRRRSTSCGCAMAKISPARRRRSRYGETLTLGGVERDLPSGRPRARLGADRGRVQGHERSSPPATTRRRRSDLRAVRAGALRRLHHRGDFRPAGVPPRRRRRRDRQAAAFGRAVSRARASGRRLFARQGAAGDRAASATPATTSRSICTARWRSITRLLREPRHRPRPARAGARRGARPSLPAPSRSARRRRCRTCWTRRFPDPVPCFASGWMRVRARARQRGVELPLVISDHADWDGLTATIAATGAVGNLGDARPGGRAGALVRAARTEGAAARHRRLRRRGRERRHHRRRRPARHHEPASPNCSTASPMSPAATTSCG